MEVSLAIVVDLKMLNVGEMSMYTRVETVFTKDKTEYSVVVYHGEFDGHHVYLTEREEGKCPEGAILYLLSLGCVSFIGILSCGSLKNDIHPGFLVVPHDFILHPNNVFEPNDKCRIIYPSLNAPLITHVKRALSTMGHSLIGRGVFVQNNAYHFETSTEVRQFSAVGDIVAHNGGDEACFIQSHNCQYCLIGVVDHMGAGLDERVDKSSLSRYIHTRTRHRVILRHCLQVLVREFTSHLKSLPPMVDQIIHARYVLPMKTPDDPVLEYHSIVIDDCKIVDVLPIKDALMKYTPKAVRYRISHAVIPGLINCHTHSSMSLMRGYGDDLPLIEWLTSRIWPCEREFCQKERFLEDAMQVAIGEMLHSGTTCFNDMYFCPERQIESCIESGIRSVLGLSFMKFKTLDGENAAEMMENHGKFLKEWSGKSPLVTFSLAPHAPYTVDDDLWQMVKEKSAEWNISFFVRCAHLRIHSHIHETEGEVSASIAQDHSAMGCHLSNEAMSPLLNLDRMGLLSDKFIAVHMTALTAAEIAVIAKSGVHVVHNPSSNLKLASGICPVKTLLDAGVNVCLGTDSAASNNSLSMFNEMRLAALLGKVKTGDASAVSAREVLYMATLAGAKALGLADKVGSIEPGKEADLVALDMDRLEMVPLYDVPSQIVYCGGRDIVTDVWVRGRSLIRDQVLNCLDENKLFYLAQHWAEDIKSWVEEGPSYTPRPRAFSDFMFHSY